MVPSVCVDSFTMASAPTFAFIVVTAILADVVTAQVASTETRGEWANAVDTDERDRKAIYGPDSRVDETDTTAGWRAVGRSTVMLVRPGSIGNPAPYNYATLGTLGSQYPCTGGTPNQFSNQPTVAFCSGEIRVAPLRHSMLKLFKP